MATSTLDMLLAALNREGLPPVPDPAKPMPIPVSQPPLAGPMLGAAPEPAPVAPLPAADMNFVNQFAGPAPVAPVLNDPTTLDKIAAVLGGVAFGPQFGAQLREERDRPIREYQAQLERFQNRRTRGLEIDTERRERAQDRATRQAEIKANREFEQWAQRAKITDELALQQARQAFDLQKLREQERIADERQDRQLRAAQEKQRREIENKLATDDGAPPNIAKEISEYQVGLRPELSTAAQKWRSLRAQKLAAQLARVGGGGGSGSGDTMVDIVDPQGNVLLGPLPYGKVRFDNGVVQGFPDASIRRAQRQGQPAAAPVAGASPQGFPLAPGTPGAPGAFQEVLPGGIRMTTPASGPTDAEVKSYAKRFKMSPDKARKELSGQ